MARGKTYRLTTKHDPRFTYIQRSRKPSRESSCNTATYGCFYRRQVSHETCTCPPLGKNQLESLIQGKLNARKRNLLSGPA